MGTEKNKDGEKPSPVWKVSHELLLILMTVVVIGFVLYNLWSLMESLRVPLGQ